MAEKIISGSCSFPPYRLCVISKFPPDSNATSGFLIDLIFQLDNQPRKLRTEQFDKQPDIQ